MIEHELNARPLEYSEVGEKFVVHPAFKNLTNLNNSIVIGPRGSGKTTMLRMLTPEALKHWTPTNDDEISIKSNISFLGIYIPMSRILQDELEKRYKDSKLSKRLKDNVINNIYFLNIVESILDLIHFLIIDKGYDKESIIHASTLLNKTLKLNLPYCYKISTVARGLSELKLNTRRKLFLKESEYKEDVIYTGQIFTNLEPVFKVVNEIFDFSPNQKYALCFDELDVYASDFSAEMIRNLRGATTNIILKLTLAPLHEIKISSFVDPPERIHDYEKIYLWPNPESNNNSREDEEKKYLQFSENLAIQSLNEIKKGNYNLDKILGEFSYRKVFEHMKKSESKNNIFNGVNLNNLKDEELENLIFLKTSERSSNFKDFLIKNKISLENLKENRETSSSIVRKIKEIVFNRIITTKYVNGKYEFRNQNVPIQYHGKELILKIIDGNPRYLKKLMQFLSKEIIIENGEIKQIPISKQARSLVKIKDLFIQRIEAIPIDSSNNRPLIAKNLINDIGEYLSNDINLKNDWKTTSFKSYIKIPNRLGMSGYTKILKRAINNGALLMIGDTDLEKLHTIKNKSLRLNYLLHIEYKIPIRKYYPTSYENIISYDIKPKTNTLFDDL